MTVIRSINWPLSTRLMCMAVHRKAVDVSAEYNPKNKDVISVQCPDCRNVYWRWRKPSDAPRPPAKKREASAEAGAVPASAPPWMALKAPPVPSKDPC